MKLALLAAAVAAVLAVVTPNGGIFVVGVVLALSMALWGSGVDDGPG
jgi:hypothetical protein